MPQAVPYEEDLHVKLAQNTTLRLPQYYYCGSKTPISTDTEAPSHLAQLAANNICMLEQAHCASSDAAMHVAYHMVETAQW
jgi:hypothetical protein